MKDRYIILQVSSCEMRDLSPAYSSVAADCGGGGRTATQMPPGPPVKNSGGQKGQNDLFDQKGQNDAVDPRNPSLGAPT